MDSGVKWMPESLAAELFVDQLAAEGTRYIFSLPGPTIEPLFKALSKRSDIKRITGLHEQTAVGMAIGYAQASGKPGVVALDKSFGLASGLATVITAASARVPLVVVAGQHDSRVANELPAAADLSGPCKPFVKWLCQVKTASELPRMLRRAFHEALSAPTGPTVVCVPVNYLNEAVSERVIMPARNAALGPTDPAFLKSVTQMLISARKPAMLVGNEVSQYRARKQAVALAEVLGCAVFCELQPSGLNFPNRHPQFAGVLPGNQQEAHDLLQGHDVLLVLGMQNRRPQNYEESSLIPASAVVVQINVDPSLAAQALPCHFSAHADLSETLSRLRAELQLQVDTQWVANAKTRCRQTTAWTETLQTRQAQESLSAAHPQAISVKWFLSVLDTARPAKSIVINDYSGAAEAPLQILNLDASSSYLAANQMDSGYGLAMGIGAQLASSEYTAICLTSDSSAIHQPQGLWTAAHYGLPAKIVIFNRQRLDCSGALHTADTDAGGPGQSIVKPPVSFLELAGSMGVPANCIQHTSQIEAALKEMFAQEGPYLLDVRLNQD